MKTAMTPQELADYIRLMPDDEVVSITIEYREEREGNGGEGETETV